MTVVDSAWLAPSALWCTSSQYDATVDLCSYNSLTSAWPWGVNGYPTWLKRCSRTCWICWCQFTLNASSLSWRWSVFSECFVLKKWENLSGFWDCEHLSELSYDWRCFSLSGFGQVLICSLLGDRDRLLDRFRGCFSAAWEGKSEVGNSPFSIENRMSSASNSTTASSHSGFANSASSRSCICLSGKTLVSSPQSSSFKTRNFLRTLSWYFVTWSLHSLEISSTVSTRQTWPRYPSGRNCTRSLTEIFESLSG